MQRPTTYQFVIQDVSDNGLGEPIPYGYDKRLHVFTAGRAVAVSVTKDKKDQKKRQGRDLNARPRRDKITSKRDSLGDY